jgi:hypothetical protein
MSTTDDRHVIVSMARKMRSATFAVVVQMLGIVGVWIYNAPPFAVIRRPSAEPRAASGSAAGKAADASAAARDAMPQANLGPLILRVVFTGASAAVVLLLSFVIPRLVADSNRRRIAAGTWSIRKGTGDKSLPESFTDEMLKHDTGKLAFGYAVQLGIKVCITGFATVFASFPYFLFGGSPIVLAAVVLFIAATLLPFPTPSHLASWLDRQRELLAQERQDALSTLHDAQLRARQRGRENPDAGKGLLKRTNRVHRAGGSSGLEDEVCRWLTEDVGAKNLDRSRESSHQKSDALDLERHPSGADLTANPASDARTPTVDRADSPLSTLGKLPRLSLWLPGRDAWEQVRVSLAIALVYSVFIGLFVYIKIAEVPAFPAPAGGTSEIGGFEVDREAVPRVPGWDYWLFLAPFILIGIALLALFVDRVIAAIKHSRYEKSWRSRRPGQSRQSQVEG